MSQEKASNLMLMSFNFGVWVQGYVKRNRRKYKLSAKDSFILEVLVQRHFSHVQHVMHRYVHGYYGLHHGLTLYDKKLIYDFT